MPEAAVILREFEVEFVGVRPVTINWVARQHRMQWSQHTKETRRTWFWIAKQAGLPALGRAGITVVPLHANRKHLQDAAGCAPEAKAAIDGLVDAGVLPGDDPEHVLWVRFDAPLICRSDGMRLLIHEVA